VVFLEESLRLEAEGMRIERQTGGAAIEGLLIYFQILSFE
jgi:hypothetical protein